MEVVAKKCPILVGDANGADKAVQKFLAECEYPGVTVFCMQECRNNLGNWPCRSIRSNAARKDFSYYAAKDDAMSKAADCGIMLWDGESNGALNNILKLMSQNKRVLVYLAPERAFFKLNNSNDVTDLLMRCDKGSIEAALKKIGRSSAVFDLQLPFQP